MAKFKPGDKVTLIPRVLAKMEGQTEYLNYGPGRYSKRILEHKEDIFTVNSITPSYRAPSVTSLYYDCFSDNVPNHAQSYIFNNFPEKHLMLALNTDEQFLQELVKTKRK